MTLHPDAQTLIERRLADGTFRHDLVNLMPEGAQSVLEFGYGDGTMLLAAKKLGKARRIYGIDIEEKDVARHFDEAWHFDLSLEGKDLDPEWTGAFDCVVSSNTLEHVYDPWRVLSKLRRCLAPGGRLIVEIPNVQCWESLYRIAVGEFPYTSGAHFDSTHIRWYTAQSFCEMLEFVGFVPESLQPLVYGADLSFLDRVETLTTLELPPPGINSDAKKIVIRFPVDIKPLYPFYVAPRFIVTASRGEAPLVERSAGYHAQFEEHRLTNPSRCRLIPRIIGDPINNSVARKLGERLGRPVEPCL